MPQNAANCFGHAIPSPLDLFRPEFDAAKELAIDQLSKIIDQNIQQSIMEMLSGTADSIYSNGKISARKERAVAEAAKSILRHSMSRQIIEGLLKKRSENIAEQLEGLVKEQFRELESLRMVDYGCGHGMIPYYLRQALGEGAPGLLTVLQLDIYDHRLSEVKDEFEFIRPEQLDKKHYEQFDFVLLHTVLHHTEDPATILSNCGQILKPYGKAIIVESCVGIRPEMLSEKVAGYDQTDTFEPERRYGGLNLREQMIYSVFFDWFYCYILSDDNILTSYQFGTPDNWDSWIGEEIRNLNLIKSFYLGFQHDVGPLFQTVHIVERIN